MTAQDGANNLGSGQKQPRIFKFVGLGILALVMFWVGVGVGNGKIAFSSSVDSANKDLPANLDYASVEEVYDLLKANYDGNLSEAKLLDGIKAGLAEATGDPYTQYLNPKDAKEFTQQLNGSFTGIGAELGEDEKGNLIIVAPIEGSPASKAGLRPQDVIVSVDNKSTADMSIDEAVSRIRGPKNTKVTLQLLRGGGEDIKLTLTRDNIKIDSVKWETMPGNIGYIKINQFSEDTTGLINQAARQLKEKGVKGVVLDLRGNPGGLLPTAVDVSNLWLGEGQTIVQEKRGGVITNTSTAKGGALLEGMPTVVLINAGSASASEIVAGALRDNKAATIIGEKSFGKGSVQQIQPLPSGAEVKITIARWYRPNGQNIDKKGISPDREVKMTDEDYKQKRDPQKDAAVQFLKDK